MSGRSDMTEEEVRRKLINLGFKTPEIEFSEIDIPSMARCRCCFSAWSHYLPVFHGQGHTWADAWKDFEKDYRKRITAIRRLVAKWDAQKGKP